VNAHLPTLAFGAGLTLVGCSPASSDTLQTALDGLVFDRLILNNPLGDLTLTGGDEARLTADLGWRGEVLPHIETRLVGGTLWVEALCAEVVACEISLRVVMPDTVAAELRTEEGAVKVTGISGEVDVRVGDGTVDLTDLAGSARVDVERGDVLLSGLSGPLQVHATEGQVIGIALEAPSTLVRAPQGPITLEYGLAPTLVEAWTATGAITVAVPPGDYDLITRTTLGQVTVEGVRDTANASSLLVLESERGDLTVQQQ
jgi:hypothetical protein